MNIILCILGVAVALLPAAGLPQSIDDLAFICIGVLITMIALSFLLHKKDRSVVEEVVDPGENIDEALEENDEK